MLLKNVLDEFLIAQEADGSSTATIRWYRALLKKFSDWFFDDRIDEISTNHVRKYIIHIRGHYKQQTANAHVRALHKFWKWCVSEYGIVNPMRNIRYPDTHKTPLQPKAVATDDLGKLFDAISNDIQGKRDRAIVAFLIDSGARAGGVVSLKTDNVDLVRCRAVVTEKGGKSRVVVFTRLTSDLISDWLKVRSPGTEYLFYNMRTLNPLTVSGLEQLLKRIKKKAGVTGRVNPHAFRHGYAREYLKAGGDLARLSRLMGHKDISTTANHYAVFTMSELADDHEQYSQIRHLLDNESGDE